MAKIEYMTAVVFTGNYGFPLASWSKTLYVDKNAGEVPKNQVEALNFIDDSCFHFQVWGELTEEERREVLDPDKKYMRMVKQYPVLRIDGDSFALTPFVTDEFGNFPPKIS
ncbi:MAG: hypothetical protein WC824_06030 [Bacteroidota bacterium]|jgi:hypothetical protein